MNRRRVMTIWLITMAIGALLALSTAPLYAATVYDTAVSYWKLDETSGGTAYDSRNYPSGNNGTISGAQPTSSGMVGGAYKFNNNEIYTSNSTVATGWEELSISCWVKVDSFVDDSGIFNSRGEPLTNQDRKSVV